LNRIQVCKFVDNDLISKSPCCKTTLGFFSLNIWRKAIWDYIWSLLSPFIFVLVIKRKASKTLKVSIGMSKKASTPAKLVMSCKPQWYLLPEYRISDFYMISSRPPSIFLRFQLLQDNVRVGFFFPYIDCPDFRNYSANFVIITIWQILP